MQGIAGVVTPRSGKMQCGVLMALAVCAIEKDDLPGRCDACRLKNCPTILEDFDRPNQSAGVADLIHIGEGDKNVDNNDTPQQTDDKGLIPQRPPKAFKSHCQCYSWHEYAYIADKGT